MSQSINVSSINVLEGSEIIGSIGSKNGSIFITGFTAGSGATGPSGETGATGPSGLIDGPQTISGVKTFTDSLVIDSNNVIFAVDDGSYNLGTVKIGSDSIIDGSPSDSFANLYVGQGAGQNFTNTSSNETFIGAYAGYGAVGGNANGVNNTFLGTFTGFNNTSGQDNVFIGYNSGYNNTSGRNNIFIGSSDSSTNQNTVGNDNICIGKGAGLGGTGLSNSMALGNGTTVNTSNTIQIGRTSVTDVKFGLNNTTCTAFLFTNTSDERLKSNVTENVLGIEFIKNLRPVTYTINNQQHTGLIAQEIEQAVKSTPFPDFGGVHAPSASSEFYSVNYSEFIAPLIKSIQELTEQNKLLRTDLDALAKRI